jgi:hypothetical protein
LYRRAIFLLSLWLASNSRTVALFLIITFRRNLLYTIDNVKAMIQDKGGRSNNMYYFYTKSEGWHQLQATMPVLGSEGEGDGRSRGLISM